MNIILKFDHNSIEELFIYVKDNLSRIPLDYREYYSIVTFVNGIFVTFNLLMKVDLRDQFLEYLAISQKIQNLDHETNSLSIYDNLFKIANKDSKTAINQLFDLSFRFINKSNLFNYEISFDIKHLFSISNELLKNVKINYQNYYIDPNNVDTLYNFITGYFVIVGSLSNFNLGNIFHKWIVYKYNHNKTESEYISMNLPFTIMIYKHLANHNNNLATLIAIDDLIEFFENENNISNFEDLIELRYQNLIKNNVP